MPLEFIFIPLLGAVFMPVMRKLFNKGATYLSTLVCLLLIGDAVRVVYRETVLKSGIHLQRMVLGEQFILEIDFLSAVVLLSISLVALATVIFAAGSKVEADRRPGFNSLILLTVTGMNGLVMATDIFSVYVFLEIVSISSFILIAYQLDDLGTEGSFKYMMLSAIATVFLLTGIAILFAFTGTVSFTGIAAGLKDGTPLVHLGMALIAFAFAVKAGMIPFHGWLPDAYTAASAPVSILLAGIITKVVGVYTMFRVVSSIFSFAKPITDVLMILGAVSMVLGAFMALGQRDFKRMLAFSSISQIGYMMMSFATGTAIGLIGAVFHFFNHSIFKSLLFLNAGAVESATGTRKFDDLGGLANRMPVTGVTSVIGLLSTAGIPPLAGFWSKVLIIIALWVSGNYIYAGLAVFTSVVTLAYLLVLQREVFFGKTRPELESITEVSPLKYIPAILMAGLTVGCGLFYPVVIDKLIIPAKTIMGLIVK